MRAAYYFGFYNVCASAASFLCALMCRQAVGKVSRGKPLSASASAFLPTRRPRRLPSSPSGNQPIIGNPSAFLWGGQLGAAVIDLRRITLAKFLNPMKMDPDALKNWERDPFSFGFLLSSLPRRPVPPLPLSTCCRFSITRFRFRLPSSGCGDVDLSVVELPVCNRISSHGATQEGSDEGSQGSAKASCKQEVR